MGKRIPIQVTARDDGLFDVSTEISRGEVVHGGLMEMVDVRVIRNVSSESLVTIISHLQRYAETGEMPKLR